MNFPVEKKRTSTLIAIRATMTGLVQGIGMRPAIARFASQLLLTGYVGNSNNGVEVHVEGVKDSIDRFKNEFHLHWPKQARIESQVFSSTSVKGFKSFEVLAPCRSIDVNRNVASSQAGSLDSESVANSLLEKIRVHVPADVVVCKNCLTEVQDPNDRRFNYPFTSCTDCGPRYSIIERMPFERADTSMNEFPMCDDCQREYNTTDDRRFYSQANACPECGPQVWLRDVDNKLIAREHHAIVAASKVLMEGGIVALRGLGGYQLLVDGTSQDAVERLRTRKLRRGKPLAILVATLAAAQKFADLDGNEADLLCSSAGPIVIARAKADSGIATSVAQGLNTIGVMLPTTPLHWLLLSATFRGRMGIDSNGGEVGLSDDLRNGHSEIPLVCTSANLDGEPIVYKRECALEKLKGIADVWLEHDRPIARPVDDSVMQIMAGRPAAIRLARGYAPLPLKVPTHRSAVALGGHQKCSHAISNDFQAVLGPHIGDLNTIAARQRYMEQASKLSTLYGFREGQFASDQHPEYYSSQVAVQLLAQQLSSSGKGSESNRISTVQHHHAHIVAGMLDRGWLDREVLGVAFDGTGYGSDQTIWGGEFIRATTTCFERVGHLRPFSLPGGELAIRQPWRIAVALVSEALGASGLNQLDFAHPQTAQVASILDRPKLLPLTTSVGRLFDGIAALILGMEQCDFEGQAAMLLESECDRSITLPYEITVENTHPTQLDWRPMVKQVMVDRAAKVKVGTMAMRFHCGLALSIGKLAKHYPELPVVLGGGVFQNRILVELVANQFHGNIAISNQELGLPGLIPVNDGGLAAGQLAIALAATNQERNSICV